jgi:acyl-coenzyme A synthetase/AMP-(fatty) acid ligase
MPHRPLANLMYWQLKRSPFPSLTRTLQFSSLLFDPLFQEIFCTFAEGGTLALISEVIKRDPEYLLAMMDTEKIERIYLPFIALQQLAEFAQATGKTLSCLREILTAGEQLQITPELRAWLKSMPQCSLYNYYGPSETHVVTSFQLPIDPHTWVSLPPIGAPIANTQIYVLDDSLFPVPIGVAGELYIGGDSVGRGYANRPHLTAERFLPDPFSDEAGSLLYKTGDRVRYLSNGNLEFLGRLDSQVKIRGYRVEPGEIEFLLQQHAQVKRCAVVVQGEGSEKRLLAYIVAYEKDTKLNTTLPAYLKTKLPEHMVPVAYILMDHLPVTATGKVNRKALLDSAPEKIEIDRNEASVAPRTPLEQQLLNIWSELLHVAAIGIHDNFFEIGGQSLLATRLMVCIRERIQPDFALQTVFEAPTIAALAETIVRQEIEKADSELLLQLFDQLESTRI